MASLRSFVADLLDTQGAMVELIEPDGLDVLAPEPLRSALGWQELTRLGFGATQPPDALRIGLEGDWLDRFGALLADRGRLAERQLDVPAGAGPPGDPAAMLNHALELPNAVWRLKDHAPAWARLLLLTFRYTATSDEKREGLVTLGFNCTTGAVLGPDLLARLASALEPGGDWRAPDNAASLSAGHSWTATTIASKVRPLIEHRVHRDLEPFLAAMRRRLDRDASRVHTYHEDLSRAAQLKLAAAKRGSGDKAEAAAKREAQRIIAIERDYAAKLADLRHNFALKITVEWVQGLIAIAPVQRYRLLVKRRKGEREVCIDWHPAARLLEQPPCDWGLGLTPVRFACDDALHLTDATGAAGCASCGKAYCRACHPATCPRCGRA
jgi:hypothetical protein